MSVEFYLSIAAMLFGVAVVALVFFFGHKIYWSSSREQYFDRWIMQFEEIRHIRIRDLKEVMEEYLERRNEFWELFGRVALSIVVVVLLVGLLMMNKIEAAAGLPILSAIVAFVVGKGIGGSGRLGARGPNEQ